MSNSIAWRWSLFASLQLVAVTGAHATCEASFLKAGSPLGGQKFSAQVTIANVTPVVALRQFRGIAVTSGYDIIVDESEYGSLLIEQPRSTSGATRPIPIVATSVAVGTASTVKIEAKLPGGMFVKSDAVRTELCSLLSKIIGGKAGIAAAGKGTLAVSNAAPRKVDALTLSQEISLEAQKNAAIIPSRYNGKSFTISGTVDYVIANAGTYRIAFIIPTSTNDLAIKLGKFRFLTQISCLVARGQSSYALTLKKGNRVTLTGTYRDYDHFAHVMWFDGCRPA